MPSAVQVQVGAALEGRTDGVPSAAELERSLGSAVRATLGDQRVSGADVSITLLDDAEIADMNRRFLSRDDVTDVIAFALYESPEPPVGDIYIGYDQAVRQAHAAGVALPEELVRLTVHGVLHVLGHDHPEDDDRMSSAMWQLQERIVERVMVP
jgi:probable rRNA maturation factor